MNEYGCLSEKFPGKYGLIGDSQRMLELYHFIELVAPEDVTVFIKAERGTGKELVAKAIHQESNRKNGPYVVINCAAIQPTLLESELFGYEKGTFTGAYRGREGKIMAADGGTLFMDEIAELNLECQPKLLRVMEYKEVEKLGKLKKIKSDVRFITATSKDMNRLVKNGSFRQELYDRINVFPIHIPPLRERDGDISMLIDYFIEANGGKGITKEARDMLVSYDWPGNIRQLKSTIERLLIYTKRNEIDIETVKKYANLKDITYENLDFAAKNKDRKTKNSNTRIKKMKNKKYSLNDWISLNAAAELSGAYHSFFHYIYRRDEKFRKKCKKEPSKFSKWSRYKIKIKDIINFLDERNHTEAIETIKTHLIDSEKDNI